MNLLIFDDVVEEIKSEVGGYYFKISLNLILYI